MWQQLQPQQHHALLPQQVWLRFMTPWATDPPKLWSPFLEYTHHFTTEAKRTLFQFDGTLAEVDPEIATLVGKEKRRQVRHALP